MKCSLIMWCLYDNDMVGNTGKGAAAFCEWQGRKQENHKYLTYLKAKFKLRHSWALPGDSHNTVVRVTWLTSLFVKSYIDLFLCCCKFGIKIELLCWELKILYDWVYYYFIPSLLQSTISLDPVTRDWSRYAATYWVTEKGPVFTMLLHECH